VRFANWRAPAPTDGADCQPVIVPQCGTEKVPIMANLARIAEKQVWKTGESGGGIFSET
jgi:hypothetical protein